MRGTAGKMWKQLPAQNRSRTSRLGNYFPDGECRPGVQQAGQFCIPAHDPLAAPAGRATGDTSEGMDPGSAYGNGSASAARHRAISDASYIIKIIVKLCAGKPRMHSFESELHGNRPALTLVLRHNLPMVRPARRVDLTGESPVRVSARAPVNAGSRREGRSDRTKRSVESACQREGSKPAGRNKVNAATASLLSAERCLRGPRRSCRGEGNRQHSAIPDGMLDLSGSLRRRHVGKDRSGTGETLPGSLVGQGPRV